MMMSNEQREAKKLEVMNAIKPICEAFGIKNFEYIMTEHTERLRLNNTLIGCYSNSVSAVIDEVIGYIFVARYCKNRYIGAFRTQTLNCIREHWIKEDIT